MPPCDVCMCLDTYGERKMENSTRNRCVCACASLLVSRAFAHSYIYAHVNDVFGLIFRVDFSTVSPSTFRSRMHYSFIMPFFVVLFRIFFFIMWMRHTHTHTPSVYWLIPCTTPYPDRCRKANEENTRWGVNAKKDRVILLWIFYIFSKRFCVWLPPWPSSHH